MQIAFDSSCMGSSFNSDMVPRSSRVAHEGDTFLTEPLVLREPLNRVLFSL